ncbi:MAG: hypothetical protein ACT6FD_07465 [Methanosarcinaceae archaeon]
MSKQYSKSKKGKWKKTADVADADERGKDKDNASVDASAKASVDVNAKDKDKGKSAKGIITVRKKTPEERKQNYITGIIKTVVASILGIVAGFIAFNQFGTAEDTKWYAILTIIAVIAYYVQRIIFPAIKIDTKEFGFKSWFYVEFLVIDFCLVTWILLLN